MDKDTSLKQEEEESSMLHVKNNPTSDAGKHTPPPPPPPAAVRSRGEHPENAPPHISQQQDDDDDNDDDMDESPIMNHREGGGDDNDDEDVDVDDEEDDMNQETQQLSEQQHGDDDVSKEEEETTSKKKTALAPIILGGSIETSAFCLLQGFMEDPDSNKNNKSSNNNNKSPIKKKKKLFKPITVPINRLPAFLGRSHNTTDANFFGLGKNIKAVSRVQFCIDYRIRSGTIGQVSAATSSSADGTTSDKFIYQPNLLKQEKDFKNKNKEKEVVIFNPTNAPQDEAGFYAITCKGKNPIRVNGLKVDQDQTCLLTHGSDIKISAFSLYFLLPSEPSTKTMQVTVPCGSGERKSQGNVDHDNDSDSAAAAASSKKRKAEMLHNSTTPKTAATMAVPSAAGAVAAVPATKRRRFPNQSLQDDLDNMTTEELLNEVDVAVEKGTWDRRCGFMGSTILYRAVREAAHARQVQETLGPDGVSKAQIVGWIHASAKFGRCTQLMQSKLEKKSYQCSIARAMQRAGYTRCSDKSFGRHVRWQLPANIEQKYVKHQVTTPRQTGDGGQADAADDDDDDDDDDNSSAGASQDDVSQEDKVADGNENDSNDDNNEDHDDNNGEEGADDGATGGAWKQIKTDIDTLSTKQLLEEFHQAVAHDRWDRRCQFVASTLGYRAVMETARSAKFRQCAEPDGVSRAQVVTWITESKRFRKWAEYMAEKLKPRSYQANIVKSMQLVGFHRSSVKTFGCNIRWHLPDIPIDENVDDDDGDDDDDDDENNDDDVNGDGDDGSGSDAQSQRSAADVKKEDSDNGVSGSDDDDDSDNHDDGQS